jgi:hypothetical protein
LKAFEAFFVVDREIAASFRKAEAPEATFEGEVAVLAALQGRGYRFIAYYVD